MPTTAVPVAPDWATPDAFVTSNVVPPTMVAVTVNVPLLPADKPVIVTPQPTVKPCAAAVVYRHVEPDTNAAVVTVDVETPAYEVRNPGSHLNTEFETAALDAVRAIQLASLLSDTLPANVAAPPVAVTAPLLKINDSIRFQ
jgi:hypothetical protein